MITIDDLEKKYLTRIPKAKGRRDKIAKWIETPLAQGYIEKALACALTLEDNRTVYQLDRAGYTHLYWLTFIYMHHLTVASAIYTHGQKMIKKLSAQSAQTAPRV